jgi:hypothetical protein
MPYVTETRRPMQMILPVLLTIACVGGALAFAFA